MRTVFRFIFFALLSLGSGQALCADTIRIAFIDALSGRYADIGFISLRQYQEAIAHTNANGGALGLELELVPLDDASSVQKALDNLDLAIKQGIRYITQGNNPEVTVALVEAIDAHNLENPGRPVLFLNYGDAAPKLDSEQCSFWHFRFDASMAMKVQAIVTSIPDDESVKTVYLLNQDEPRGHEASRALQRAFSELRAEIQVVGDDLHPVGNARDIADYVRRARDANVNAIITAARGADLAAVVAAATTDGVQRTGVYMISDFPSGVPAAAGESSAAQLTGVFTWHANVDSKLLERFADAYRDKHNEDWYGLPSYAAVQMLAASMEIARSTEPLPVARALEGLSFLGATGPIALREDNHQLLQPLFVARLVRAHDDQAITAAVGSKLGWKTVLRREPDETALETTCAMQRPAAKSAR